MGIGLGIVDHDKAYHQEGRREKTIINDLPEVTEADKDKINSLVSMRFDANSLLSNLPTCECGQCNKGYEIGETCPNCFGVVADPLEQTLEPVVWVRAPDGVDGIPNPIIWNMLTKIFSPNGFDLMRWFSDSSYSEPDREPPELDAIRGWKFGPNDLERGLNNFIRHFDEIYMRLCNLKRYRTKREEIAEMSQLLAYHRGKVFPKVLSLPNRALMVIEKNNMGTYIDPMINGAMDAIRTVASIDAPTRMFSTRVKENRIVKMISLLAKYHNDIYAKKLAMKEGVFRKHVFGTRSHWSFRAVISSLTDRHKYTELQISWGIGVTTLRVHLINKLDRMGWTINAASEFLYNHTQKYHPLLDQLFQELINESPDGKGIAVMFQRNPSLERGSAQFFYVTLVKGMFNHPEMVKDPTVSLPILDVKGFNADLKF